MQTSWSHVSISVSNRIHRDSKFRKAVGNPEDSTDRLQCSPSYEIQFSADLKSLDVNFTGDEVWIGELRLRGCSADQVLNV